MRLADVAAHWRQQAELTSSAVERNAFRHCADELEAAAPVTDAGLREAAELVADLLHEYAEEGVNPGHGNLTDWSRVLRGALRAEQTPVGGTHQVSLAAADGSSTTARTRRADRDRQSTVGASVGKSPGSGHATSSAASQRPDSRDEGQAALGASSLPLHDLSVTQSSSAFLQEAVAQIAALPKWDKRTVPGGFHVNRQAVLDIIDAALSRQAEKETA